MAQRTMETAFYLPSNEQAEQAEQVLRQARPDLFIQCDKDTLIIQHKGLAVEIMKHYLVYGQVEHPAFTGGQYLYFDREPGHYDRC